MYRYPAPSPGSLYLQCGVVSLVKSCGDERKTCTVDDIRETLCEFGEKDKAWAQRAASGFATWAGGGLRILRSVSLYCLFLVPDKD